MKKIFYLSGFCLVILFGCSKEEEFFSPELYSVAEPEQPFLKYNIRKGQQYCDESIFTPVSYAELKFKVKFDSSAIYTSLNPSNQYDINKLYGFSDNNADHHQFSARFGWRWSNDSLRLFGYTYNGGVRESKELGTVILHKENYCSIKVEKDNYVFTLNNKIDSMQRKSTTQQAIGYKLYPYFGGDEFAPHEINIWIKED